MKKFLIFSVAFVTTTLLCLSCQKEDVVAPMDVATTKSENVQKGRLRTLVTKMQFRLQLKL